MSQENVEVVRRLFDAYAAGGVEAALSFFAPSVVLHPYPEWPGPSEYRGHDGIRALMAEWTENFDDFEMEGSTRSARSKTGCCCSQRPSGGSRARACRSASRSSRLRGLSPRFAIRRSRVQVPLAPVSAWSA